MKRTFHTTNHLRALRLAAGLSQEDLALWAGISQQHVARLELGRQRGRPATWRRVAAALGVAVDLLAPTPAHPRPRRRRRARASPPSPPTPGQEGVGNA